MSTLQFVFLTARALTLAGESEDAKNVLLLSCGLNSFWDPQPLDKFLEPSRLKKALQITRSVLGYLFLFFVIIAFLTIHAMILIDISRNPSISVGVSAAVVCIVVALDLIGLLNSYIRVGIFPFKNNWFKNELFVKYHDIYAANLKTAQEKYVSQWAIVRFITRPNPGKMANQVRRFKSETRKDWFIRWLNAKFSR